VITMAHLTQVFVSFCSPLFSIALRLGSSGPRKSRKISNFKAFPFIDFMNSRRRSREEEEGKRSGRFFFFFFFFFFFLAFSFGSHRTLIDVRSVLKYQTAGHHLEVPAVVIVHLAELLKCQQEEEK